MYRSMRVWLVAGLGCFVVLALVKPGQAGLFAGAAAGWALVVLFIFRSRERMDYQTAIRHMRRGEYEQAISVMDRLIDAGPDSVEHHSFRANLYLLNRDLRRAESDYQWVIEHAPAVPDGYVGLAETAIQQGDFDQAREYAVAALERDAGSWTAAYNLGLTEDRLGASEAVIEHLNTALARGMPDHYRLLARLWLARSYHRLGRDDDAQQQVALLRKATKGLRKWQVILTSDQGAVLRDLLEKDVQLAQQLIESEVTLAALD